MLYLSIYLVKSLNYHQRTSSETRGRFRSEFVVAAKLLLGRDRSKVKDKTAWLSKCLIR